MNANDIVVRMTALVESAEAESRSLTTDEVTQYEALEADLAAFNKTAELRARTAAYNTPVNGNINVAAPKADQDSELRALKSYLRTGQVAAEFRAQNEGTDSAGGYLVPELVSSKILEFKVSYGGFLSVVNKITTASGAKMTWPTLVPADPADAGIIPESGLYTYGSDMVFGTADLDVYKITTAGSNDLPLRITVELLEDAAVDIVALVSRYFAERIYRKESQFALTGTGSGQPKGILNGTPNVSLASGNAFTYAKLLEIEGALDPAYLSNAKWVMAPSVWSAIRGMVDDNGRPLVTSSLDGIGGGVRQSLLGYPVVLDSSAPANSGDAVNFMAFGDFDAAYVARTTSGLHVVTDPYGRMNYGEIQMVGWERFGGTVVDRSAYVLVATFNTP